MEHIEKTDRRLPKDQTVEMIGRVRYVLDRLEATAHDPGTRCSFALEYEQDIEDGPDGGKALGAFWHADVRIQVTIPRRPVSAENAT